MSEWLAAFEANFAAEIAVPKVPLVPKALPSGPIGTIGPIGTGHKAAEGTGDRGEACDAPGAVVLSKWSADIAQLKRMPAPDAILCPYWRQVGIDANRFLATWGATAAALGWTTLDLFGVHRLRPLARLDAAGLVMLLNGAEVVALTPESATIRIHSGALQRCFRRSFAGPGQVALWNLAG